MLPGASHRPDEIEPHLARVLAWIRDASGIDFSAREPMLRLRPDGQSIEGRVYYIGPRHTRQPARVKLDISANEAVLRPPVLHDIAHPYPDGPLPRPARRYSFEELLAEKIRAMAQRASPRDLYDIVNLFRRHDLRLYPEAVHRALVEKCAAKGIAVPSAADFDGSPLITALEADWAQMLAHQLPALPPLQSFLDELPRLFGWLEGTAEFEELPPLPASGNEQDWSPPPIVATWHAGVPLETVRFAATYHLCVELFYGGTWRRIEPYSLRRSAAGQLPLHAERSDGGGHRTYRVDQMIGLRATTTPFRPRYPIEFSARGPLHAPHRSRTPLGRPSISVPPPRARAGATYAYRCSRCGKEFRHSRPGASLRDHKDRQGYRCGGRSGVYLGMR